MDYNRSISPPETLYPGQPLTDLDDRPVVNPYTTRPQLAVSLLVFLPCDALRCTVFVIVILSVCPSVCHTRGLCPHGSTYDHDFFNIWYHHHSSFWGYQVHPKIRRGSPRARALNEGGVGKNWRFSTNKSPYLRNGARYDKGYY